MRTVGRGPGKEPEQMSVAHHIAETRTEQWEGKKRPTLCNAGGDGERDQALKRMVVPNASPTLKWGNMRLR